MGIQQPWLSTIVGYISVDLHSIPGGKGAVPSALGVSIGREYTQGANHIDNAEDAPSRPLGFRPGPIRLNQDPIPEPVGFSPEQQVLGASDNKPPLEDATIHGLPVAVLVCRGLREKDDPGPVLEADIVVDELPLSVEPGAVRREEERLDQVVVELRRLCELLRQTVLDVADTGEDCSLEVQELNRLVELEQDLTQELTDRGGDPYVFGAEGNGPRAYLQLRSLHEDIGGGCQAEVEGQSGAPLQTKIV